MGQLIEDYISARQTEVELQTAKLHKLNSLKKSYPDLVRNEYRWGKECFSSKSINDKVTSFEWRNNCSCCPDSAVELFPYLTVGDFKIYCEPACYRVGHQNFGNGINPFPDWKTKMHAAGLNSNLIQQVQGFLDKHTPDPNYEDKE